MGESPDAGVAVERRTLSLAESGPAGRSVLAALGSAIGAGVGSSTATSVTDRDGLIGPQESAVEIGGDQANAVVVDRRD